MAVDSTTIPPRGATATVRALPARPLPPPEARPLSLRRNFAWTLAGNAIYAGCQWGMLVAMARLGNPSMVGQFVLGLAVTAPLVVFSNLQLRAIQATDARDEYRFGHYLALRILTTLAAMLAIVAIGLLAGYDLETSLVILLFGVAKSFESISDVLFGWLQKCERMDRIAWSLVVRGVVSLVLLGLGVLLTGSAVGAVGGLAVSQAVVLFAYDRVLVSRLARSASAATGMDRRGATNLLRPCWDPHMLLVLARTALPMGVVMFLISLNTNIPRYVIEHCLDTASLGVFGSIAYFVVLGSMVVNALAQSASPRLAEYYASGNVRAFDRLLGKLVAMGIAVGGACVLAAVVAGRPILSVFYGPEYAKETGVFVLLMVVATLAHVGAFLSCAMTAARKLTIQSPLFAATTLVTFVGSVFLVPGHGLIGAAVAMLLGMIVRVFGSLVIVWPSLSRQGPPNRAAGAAA